MQENGSAHESVKEYYGKVLKSSNDLLTTACCSAPPENPAIREAFSQIHEEVVRRFYGCGSPIPEALDGCTVLDLGCGTGRDCFIASKLVGPNGYVIGVDMTDEQLSVARKHTDWQMKQFGYSKPNVDFRQGFIENLQDLKIEDNSVDVVISNCVINLSPDKERVFSEIFRVLKPGGELYFSDIFSYQRVPQELVTDKVLLGECLSGALYFEDFRRLLVKYGCPDYRVVAQSPVVPTNPQIKEKIGMIDFVSSTIRAFKLDRLEDRCEDYGQIATYSGTLPGFAHSFTLDSGHRFTAHKPMLVCGNTAAMLEESRYSSHFTIQGDRSRHFGIFEACYGTSSSEETQSNCC